MNTKQQYSMNQSLKTIVLSILLLFASGANKVEAAYVVQSTQQLAKKVMDYCQSTPREENNVESLNKIDSEPLLSKPDNVVTDECKYEDSGYKYENKVGASHQFPSDTTMYGLALVGAACIVLGKGQ